VIGIDFAIILSQVTLSQGVLHMRNNFGFTVFELTIVLAILGIVASIAVPSFSRWRGEAKMRSAVNILRGDLEMAKSRAVRENNFVAVSFVAATGYLVFIDDGAGGGTAGDYVHDSGEQLLINRQLPAGVSIDLANTTFTGNQTGFNGRGRIRNLGVVTLVNSSGAEREIDVNNRFGRITVN
jgi:type IV fimbrial biogenesis protein FimT